jgi:phage recombination protein Bet
MSTQLIDSKQQLATATPTANPLYAMATRLEMNSGELEAVLRNTVFKGASNEEFAALLIVSNEHKLNPILREIYAFRDKGGGIRPVVGVDGWAKIARRCGDVDGFEFNEREAEDGSPISVTCILSLKSLSKPVKVTERYSECYRPTEPWKQMPWRMLRHKALMQALRYGIGITGIMDEDEASDAAANAKPARAHEVTDLDALAQSDPAPAKVIEFPIQRAQELSPKEPKAARAAKKEKPQPEPEKAPEPAQAEAQQAAPESEHKPDPLLAMRQAIGQELKKRNIESKYLAKAIRYSGKISGIAGDAKDWGVPVYEQVMRILPELLGSAAKIKADELNEESPFEGAATQEGRPLDAVPVESGGIQHASLLKQIEVRAGASGLTVGAVLDYTNGAGITDASELSELSPEEAWAILDNWQKMKQDLGAGQ